ncbi:hypothetical protein GCM10010448_36490 [Streptomyces glomeratus]|uniref:Transposase n=1 Tax=Streptomyces glomeratus TaxID=284452 RepID=A0ABP6LM16_9ACTN
MRTVCSASGPASLCQREGSAGRRPQKKYANGHIALERGRPLLGDQTHTAALCDGRDGGTLLS